MHYDDVNLVGRTLSQRKPWGPPLKASTPQGGNRPQDARTPSFQAICFECFLPGHRRPLCPHLDRTMVDPAFKAWVAANFAALEQWQQAWLKSIGRAPESATTLVRGPPTTAAPTTAATPTPIHPADAHGAEPPPGGGGLAPPPAPGSPLQKFEPETQVVETLVALTSLAQEKRLPPSMQPPSPINIIEVPFGLPPFMDLEEYRADPICYLSQFNYKLDALIGPDTKTQQPLLTVLDTGAGPNLIRADLLPQRLLDELDRTREIVNIASASKHRLDVLGTLALTVTVESSTVRLPF
eukprot:IDg22458t1